MKLNLTALPKGISSFADEGHIELPEEAIKWHEVPRIKGFIDMQNDRFIIRANVTAAIVLSCSRCLDHHIVPLKDELTLVVLSSYGNGPEPWRSYLEDQDGPLAATRRPQLGRFQSAQGAGRRPSWHSAERDVPEPMEHP